MINPHPSPYVPQGTAPLSSGPDRTLTAKHDAEAMQRAIEKVQAHREDMRLSSEDFAERFGPRIMNSATELTVEQIFAKLDVNVGALPEAPIVYMPPRFGLREPSHLAIRVCGLAFQTV